MAAIYWTIGILAGVFCLFLWLIHPSMGRKKECRKFTTWDYAHRGLWDMNLGIPENSMPAFRRAVENGYAIELDVHLTADRQLVVFHDDTLKRVCGVQGTSESMELADLQKLSLSGTQDHMPTLQDVLALVDGRVPILLEIKQPTLHSEICRYLVPVMQTYQGPFLIESFNPLALRAYKKMDPTPLFGLLSERYPASLHVNPLVRILSTSLMLDAICRPDFIAYNHRTVNGTGFILVKNLFRAPVFVWTVRKPEDYKKCRKLYDAVIFERFLPKSIDNTNVA